MAGGSWSGRLCISDEAVTRLIARLKRLPSQHTDVVAEDVALLWGSLIVEFRGLDGFIAAEGDAQMSYLAQLTSSATRLASQRRSRHHFVAVASFCAYLIGWLSPRSEASVALGTCVISALVRGRSLAHERTPVFSALRAA